MPVSTPKSIDQEVVLHVAETCLCLHTQRAARALARAFDKALKPFELSNGQFSLLMALNRPEPPRIGELAPFLAMDRTSLTAALKPLERRGLLVVRVDKADRRNRLVQITGEGVALLQAALPTWRETHARLDEVLGDDVADRMRTDLRAMPSAAATLDGPGASRD